MPVLVPTLLSVRVAMSGRETNNNMRMEMRICRPVCSRFSDSTTATHGKFFHIFPIFNITKQSATGPEGPPIAGTHAGPSSCRSGWTWSALAGGLGYAGGPNWWWWRRGREGSFFAGKLIRGRLLFPRTSHRTHRDGAEPLLG